MGAVERVSVVVWVKSRARRGDADRFTDPVLKRTEL